MILKEPYLVMTPRQHHIVQTAVWLINTALGWVDSVIIIGITFERFGIDVFVWIFASDNWVNKWFISIC